MKKLFYSLALISSCFALGQVTIGTDTRSSNLPISISKNYTYSQTIYTALSIGTSGEISGIEYQLKNASLLTNSDEVDVYLSHVGKEKFANNKDWQAFDQLTKVFSGIIVSKDNKVKIEFEKPFLYNGTDNLVITVHEKKKGYGSYSNTFIGTDSTENSSLYLDSLSDSEVINPSKLSNGKLYNISPNITLLGLALAESAPSCTKATVPTDGAVNQIFLPKVVYPSAAGAEKYYVTVGTTKGGKETINHENNDNYTDFYFSKELKPETTYFVTVNPANKFGEAKDCESTSFTTGKVVANDSCDTAEEISTFPLKKSVDATYSSNAGGSVQCNGKEVANDGVWYSVEGNGADITITVTATSFWNPQIVVKEDSCAATSCLANVDETSYKGTETVTLKATKEGKKYYVNIGSSSMIDFSEGKFDLEVTTTKKLGANEVALKRLSIYPNPVTDVLFIDHIGTGKNKVEIVDFNGRLVLEGAYTTNGISVKHLPKGAYVIKVTEEGKAALTMKMLKK